MKLDHNSDIIHKSKINLMIFTYYELKDNKNYLNQFFENSVIQVNKLIDKTICKKALDYFLKNEPFLIGKYRKDSKGLVLDQYEDKSFIKYFEYPLSENFKIFGPFINNKTINLASNLLGCDVFLRSMEIHTRGSGSTEIPPHQDNGYYGLENSDALTFYIALNAQSAANGGLIYMPNKQGNEFLHKPSKSKAFSLSIDSINLPENEKNFYPILEAGDCTIHHSNSVHFANPIKKDNLERSVVVRLSFFSTKTKIKKGHLDWYQKMLKANRG